MEDLTTKRKGTKNIDEEIDFVAVTKKMWNGRKTIFRSIIICGVLGVIIALLSPKQYTASTTLVPQAAHSSAKLGGLFSLATIAGFNVNLN